MVKMLGQLWTIKLNHGLALHVNQANGGVKYCNKNIVILGESRCKRKLDIVVSFSGLCIKEIIYLFLKDRDRRF